jgi:hypothetical protein
MMVQSWAPDFAPRHRIGDWVWKPRARTVAAMVVDEAPGFVVVGLVCRDGKGRIEARWPVDEVRPAPARRLRRA